MDLRIYEMKLQAQDLGCGVQDLGPHTYLPWS